MTQNDPQGLHVIKQELKNKWSFSFSDIDGSGDDLEASGDDRITDGSGGGIDDEDLASGSGSGMAPDDEDEPRVTTKRPGRNEFEFVNTRGPKYNTPKEKKKPDNSSTAVSPSLVLLAAVLLQFVVRWL